MSLMISDDGTLHASAQHLLENFMRLAAAEPPPYRPLSRDGLNEKGNLSGETTVYTLQGEPRVPTNFIGYCVL